MNGMCVLDAAVCAPFIAIHTAWQNQKTKNGRMIEQQQQRYGNRANWEKKSARTLQTTAVHAAPTLIIRPNKIWHPKNVIQ